MSVSFSRDEYEEMMEEWDKDKAEVERLREVLEAVAELAAIKRPYFDIEDVARNALAGEKV